MYDNSDTCYLHSHSRKLFTFDYRFPMLFSAIGLPSPTNDPTQATSGNGKRTQTVTQDGRRVYTVMEGEIRMV